MRYHVGWEEEEAVRREKDEKRRVEEKEMNFKIENNRCEIESISSLINYRLSSVMYVSEALHKIIP